MESIEALIDKATNKNNVSEDWSTIMEICDEANADPRGTINYLKKKITDNNSNVVLFALTLADALVKNCDIHVRREISSRGFLGLIERQIQNRNVHEVVKKKMLYCIKQWDESFGNDPTLSYCNEVYNRLRSQNYTFEAPGKKSVKRHDSEVILKQKEDDDLQLALALSLSAEESKKNKKSSKRNNDSPASSSSPIPQQSSQQGKPLFKVKALYDFLGNYAEGELPLYCGDIINVYDTTYKDWWKGENRGMVGIFPNNYVEKIQDTSSSQPVNEEFESQVLRETQKIDEFMQILSRVDPKTENLSENEELQNLYNSICSLRPKLVKLVEYYSKKMEETNLITSIFLQSQDTYRNLYDQQQQQQQQQLYAPIQQPTYATYSQPPAPQPYSQPLPPNNTYMMPQASDQMMPPPQALPTTPPDQKYLYDPRLIQPQPQQQPQQQPPQPQQQPQQPLYMPPYDPNSVLVSQPTAGFTNPAMSGMPGNPYVNPPS